MTSVSFFSYFYFWLESASMMES